ncbi:MAG: class I SAM-dependent methyltransferase [Chthoniobacterales bacterium]
MEFASLPESALGYPITAFVRNPYDRVYSGFRQLQKDIRAQPAMTFPEPWIRDLVMKQIGENFLQLQRANFQFDRWLNSVTEEQIFELGRNTSFLLHPAHYWTHIAGRQAVDFIGKVENFEDDFQTFLTKNELTDVPKLNANVEELETGGHVSAYRYVDRMNARSIEKINRLFAADFELFGYTMLDPADHDDAIKKTLPKTKRDAVEFSGERLVRSLPPGLRVSTEHLHRYSTALPLCSGRRVLDIASGDGYGSALLAGEAMQVTGVDISPETVVRARELYERPNLTFLEGRATAIPLPDASVDVVVSFETIEHLLDHESFLHEIRRVLAKDGLLLMSTPDKSEYSDRAGLKNPHHLRELTRSEFHDLLKDHFQNVCMAGQRYVAGSWLESSAAPEGSSRGVLTADYDSMPFTLGPGEAVFCLALCSNGPLPPLQLGMCLPPRKTLDGWLEAIEIIPSPEALLKLIPHTEVRNQFSEKTEQDLVVALASLQKEKARAEKWKTKAQKRDLTKPEQKKGLIRGGWEKWISRWRL